MLPRELRESRPRGGCYSPRSWGVSVFTGRQGGLRPPSGGQPGDPHVRPRSTEGLRAGLGQPCALRLQPLISGGDTLVHTTPPAPPVTAEGRRGGGRDPFPFPFSAVAVAPSCTKVCSMVSVQGQAGPEPWPLSSGSPRGPLQGDGGMSSGRRLCNFSVFLRHQRASIMWA